MTEKIYISSDEITKGVDNEEFFLEYQPQFGINSESIEAVEALVCWNHPVHGRL